jgi:hypothetical protein
LHPQSARTLFEIAKGTLAQMVEQWTENPCVPGSIPGGTTLKIRNTLKLVTDFFMVFVIIFHSSFYCNFIKSF